MTPQTGDEHVVIQRIRIVKIHDETTTISTVGGFSHIVRTGRYVTFLFKDFSEDTITLSEEAFGRFIEEAR